MGKSATRIPIKCIAGDQQAALSEQMYVEKWQAKNNSTIGCWIQVVLREAG